MYDAGVLVINISGCEVDSSGSGYSGMHLSKTIMDFVFHYRKEFVDRLSNYEFKTIYYMLLLFIKRIVYHIKKTCD